ncbi:MAG: FKBP-type peptidyl-prolyl cis-trans isomerase [Bacteroidota bacterium]
MKRLYIAVLISMVSLHVNAQTKAKPVAAKKAVAAAKPIVKAVTFKNNLDSASYAFGFSMASQLKSGGLKSLNYDLLVKALKDVFSETTPLLTPEKAQACITNLFQKLSKEEEEVNKQKFAANITEGAAFLAQNKTKPGVIVTESGLQYEVITAGTGAKPIATDQVTVNYKGTLLNGTQFDSSYDRGEPITFGLNRVIKGWTEGLQLMPEGSKFRFFIPYNLGYDAAGSGSIPPFSALIFEIELIKIGS